MADDFLERFKQAGLAFSDSANQAFGGKQNLYGTYTAQKEKRLQMERDAAQAAATAQLTAQYRERQLALAEERNKIAGRRVDSADTNRATDRAFREQGQFMGAGYIPLQPGQKPTPDAKTGVTGSIYVPDTTNTLSKRIKELQESGIDLAPGTTIYDKRTGLRIPINPKLTEAESSAVAGVAKFKPLINEMKDLVGKGVFKGNSISRAYNQWLAEGGDSNVRKILAPDDSPLEQLMSARAEAYKIAFSEGGKQLTDTEKKIVGAGLNFVGKSDKQIMTDLGRAMSILEKKGLIATSGRTEAKQMMGEGSKGGVNLDELF